MGPDAVEKAKKMGSAAASKVVQGLIQEREKAICRSSSSLRKNDGPVDLLVRVAAAGVGLVSEACLYSQAKRLIETEANPEEGAEASQIPEVDSISSKNTLSLAEMFIRKHPHQPTTQPNTKLALPIILPQRRPGTRVRGFMRAYSPMLADALEPNPWIYAFNLAGFAGMAVPEPLMMLLGVGIGIATDAAMEAQSRFKSNKLLDCVNAEFFMPRGLVCLVVTWKPDAADGDPITTVNFEGKIAKPSSKTAVTQSIKDIITNKASTNGDLQDIQASMREMTKSSNGSFKWPDPAPLIFPAPNQIAATPRTHSDGKKMNRYGSVKHMDRRAQAQWIEENRDLPIAGLPPQPVFHGDLVAFFTGGNWRSKSDKNPQRRKSDPGSEREDVGGSVKPTSKLAASKAKPTSGFMDLFQTVRYPLKIVRECPLI
ncbi:hypothetical protein jhhlp_008378 [Lomentospora prolificans]|uniref:Uncharacterized protein n=1 Tax=Lomentospora prolificans TaxID=41688 RepID=A0A2N3MXW4_9PEZI|nr:hypothetical protein jhhlp_008378 [Lomentospora prolificans]